LIEYFSRAHGNPEIMRLKPKSIHTRYQFALRHDAGAAIGQFPFDPFADLNLPAATAQHDGRQKTAHRAADHDGEALSGHRNVPQFLKLSPAEKVFYIVPTKFGGTPWP
jgi:hypothetical protein